MGENDENDAETIARDLLNALDRRELFTQLKIDGEGIGLPLAYAIQRHMLESLVERGEGAPIGYKVGLTNPAMWEMCGVSEPVAGTILSNREVPNGASVNLSSFVRLGIESELALRIGRPIPAGRESRDPAELMECIETAHAAFELVDDRAADYGRLDAASIIAENSWNAGIVLGEGVSTPKLGALDGLHGTLDIDGETFDGSSSDVLGHPLNVVAWLADHLAGQGKSLQPGDIVMTGAIVSTKFPEAGQRFRFALGDLPPVEVAIEP